MVFATVSIASVVVRSGAEPIDPTGTGSALVITAATEPALGRSEVLDRIAASSPRFHVALGGEIEPGSDVVRSAWCDQVHAKLGDDTTVLRAASPADIAGPVDSDLIVGCLSGRSEVAGDYGREYFVDVDSLVRLIVISPGARGAGERTDYRKGAADFRWLEQTIDGAATAGVAWVVVAMEDSCLSVGYLSCGVGQELLDLLISKRVDLVLHGSERSYQRTHQLTTSAECPRVLVDDGDTGCVIADDGRGVYDKGKGSVFVVAGASSEPLWDVNEDDAEAAYFATFSGADRSPTTGILELRLSREELVGELVGDDEATFRDTFVLRNSA